MNDNNRALTTVNQNAELATTPVVDARVADIMERVMIGGDLSKLSAPERVQYYLATCRSVGLNPMTRPFEYFNLKGVLRLYPKKEAAEQIRREQGISITKLEYNHVGDLYIVTAHARTRDGREDTDQGIVSIAGLRGQDLADAMAKAISKAKRRVTLSLAGLGWAHEAEDVEAEGARHVAVNLMTGEIMDEEVQDEPNAEPPAPPPNNNGHDVPLTQPQLKAIWAIAKNERNLTQAEMERIAQSWYGVSVGKLSKRQASELIEALKDRERTISAPPPEGQEMLPELDSDEDEDEQEGPLMATLDQATTIHQLIATDAGARLWLQRKKEYDVRQVEQLTHSQARAFIDEMKGL